MGEPSFERLRVLRGRVPPDAVGQAHHERRLRLAAEHVAGLGDLIHQFVHGAEGEVEDAHLDDRPRADERRPEAGAHDGRLRDRGGDDALGAELFGEAAVLAEEAAPRDVFAENPDAPVAAHLLEGGASGRLDQGDGFRAGGRSRPRGRQLVHAGAPVSCTSP
jgi:hypothetical protein